MCCFRVSSCCCGCRPLQPGVFVLSILNLIINLSLSVLPWVMVTVVDHNGYVAWLAILMSADLALAVGCKAGIRVLILPWLIIYMINIIFTCILAPVIVFLAVLAVNAMRESTLMAENPEARDTANRLLPGKEASGGFIDKVNNLDMERMGESITAMVGAALLCLIPVWYIYIWIMARSLYLEMGEKEQQMNSGRSRRENRIVNISARQQVPVFTVETPMCDPAVLNMYNNPNNHWLQGSQQQTREVSRYTNYQQHHELQQQQQQQQLMNQPIYYPGLAQSNVLPVPTY